jgi:hypothetical protein
VDHHRPVHLGGERSLEWRDRIFLTVLVRIVKPRCKYLDVHVISEHDAAARTHCLPRRVPLVSPLAAEIPRGLLTRSPNISVSRNRPYQRLSTYHEDVTIMSEEAEKARQALQESMDLRDQGHSDD